MDLMDIQDLAFVDINELGIRSNWIDDESELESDMKTKNLFGKEELLSNQEKIISNNPTEDISMSEDDETNYEIDPETGEKTLRGNAPSPVSNDKWIEEYLTNIESSATTNSNHLFENIPLNQDQTDSNWFTNYISIDDSTVSTPNMFAEQFLPQTTSPIIIPTPLHSNSNSLTNLLSISFDDEQSVSSSHSFSFHHRNRLLSHIETDSLTGDSDLPFDESFIETKLEKIDPDEHFMPSILHRRASTRTNYQGQQDEETLRLYNIPLSLYDITQSSTDEYNLHLAHLNYLTPEQIHVIKDIRRRGKNKIAAQNCRKRKAINVESLLDEVDELKRVKHELEERKKLFQQQIRETRHSYEYLHQQVLPDRQLPPAISVK